jgi:riboflavin kinase/FMN adenylyltransferase
MKLIRGLQNLTTYAGSVVTIGNFDGVHIGHQKIISQLVKKSKELGLPSVLISFSPTPQRFFSHEQASLSSFKEKHHLLDKLGLDTHLPTFNSAIERKPSVFFEQVTIIGLIIK